MGNVKKYAVIVAGGRGVRMGAAIPKQFLPFMGKPLLCHPLQAFADALPDAKLILVMPPDQLSSAQIVLKSYLGNLKVVVVPGGETRFHSVQNGLKEVKDDGIVFVHDGARPVITTDFILDCYRHAEEYGSAIPAINIPESVRFMEDGISRPIDREKLRIIQTPQTFKTGILLPAYQIAYRPSFTDEATVVEASGQSIHLMSGLRNNIKITTPEDMLRAEALYNAGF